MTAGQAGATGDRSMRRIARSAMFLFLMSLCFALRESALELTDPAPPVVRADAADYFFYTVNLHRFGIYSPDDSLRGPPPTTNNFLRSPGLPLLAQPFAAEPEQLVPRFLMSQTIASVFAGALVFWVGCRLAGFWAGSLALFLYAIAPHLINANLYFLTEAPTAISLTAFVAALAGAHARRSSTHWLLLAGALLGIAALLRPYLLGFAPVLAGFLWIRRRETGGAAWAVALAGFCLVVLPWQVFTHLGESTDPGSLFLTSVVHGSYPDFMYNGLRESYGYPYRFDPQVPDARLGAAVVLPELWSRFLENPGEHLRWYLAGKPLALWQWPLVQETREIFIYPVLSSPFDYLPHMKMAWQLSEALHYPVLVLAFSGCLFAWTSRGAAVLSPLERHVVQIAGLLFLWTTALHLLAAPFPRYHMPLKPVLFIVAAWTLTLAVRATAKKLRGREISEGCT